MPSTVKPELLETSRRAHIAAVGLVLVFPTVATLLYFVVLSGHSAMGVVFGGAKVLQFSFPLAWVLLVQRRRIRPVKFSGRGVATGLAIGAAGVVIGLVVYYGLKDAYLAGRAASLVGEKVAAMNLASPASYLAFAVFLALPHSLLEEYYWRWFAFGELARVTPRGVAIAVSSLAFMAHHVILIIEFLPGPAWLIGLASLAIAGAGAFWAWLYQRSGSLVGPWLSHLLLDCGVMFIGYDLVDWASLGG